MKKNNFYISFYEAIRLVMEEDFIAQGEGFPSDFYIEKSDKGFLVLRSSSNPEYMENAIISETGNGGTKYRCFEKPNSEKKLKKLLSK